jgi:serine/threonine protein kinase
MTKDNIRGVTLTAACDIWSFGAVLFTSIALIPPTFALEYQDRKAYNVNRHYSVEEWIIRYDQVARFAAFLDFDDMRYEIFTIHGFKTSQPLRSMIKNMLLDNPAQRPTVENILQNDYLVRFSDKLRESKRAEPYEYLKYINDRERKFKNTEDAFQNEKKNLNQAVRELVIQRDDDKKRLSESESKNKTLEQSLRDQESQSNSEIGKLSGELVKKDEQNSCLMKELEETRRLLREIQGI